LGFWQSYVDCLSVEHLINDALMAIFFLLIGLELEREVYNGELSDCRNALLPICAAVGGLAVPALIHFYFNVGTPTQAGIKGHGNLNSRLPAFDTDSKGRRIF
jgi:Na+:H+ antiporter, NhaA family